MSAARRIASIVAASLAALAILFAVWLTKPWDDLLIGMALYDGKIASLDDTVATLANPATFK